jgi:hypothetical protein
MKRSFAALLSVALTMGFCLAAWGQDAPAGTEGITASVKNSIRMSDTKHWTPSQPEKNIGIVVHIRLAPNAAFRSEEFAVTFGVKNTAPCIGYTSAGVWFVSKDEKEPLRGMSLYTGEKAAEVPFLFVVPKDVTDVTVLYKGKPAGKALPLQPEKS